MLFKRYIFGQTSLATAMAVSLFTAVLVAGNARRELFTLLADGRIDPETFVYLLGILVPTMLPWSLPLGILFAVLLVLGRMSAWHEITALKSSGISLYSIAQPVLLFSALGSLLSMLILFVYAPAAITEFRRLQADLVRNDPLKFIQPRTFITDFPGFVLYVDTREESQLRQFYIWELDSERRIINFVQASQASFQYNTQQDAVEMTLVQGTAESRDRTSPDDLSANRPVALFDELKLQLPLDAILGQPVRKLSYLTLDELLQKLRELETRPEGQSEEEHFARKIEVQQTLQQRCAYAVSVLSMAALAFPLALRTGRTESFSNFALAVGLFLVYFSLTVALSWLNDYPRLRPDLLIWIPNVLFLATAGTLLHKAAQS